MLTKEQIQELETTHRRIARVADKDGGWEVIYRKPNRAEYKRFRSMLHDESRKADATEWLARACVVSPSADAFDALLEEYPGIADASGDALSELAGFTADKLGK